MRKIGAVGLAFCKGKPLGSINHPIRTMSALNIAEFKLMSTAGLELYTS